MEVERKRSKGGFFQLFDWNGKSRKKLFSNNSESSGESKIGEDVENILNSLPHMMKRDEQEAPSSNRRSSDLNSASSVTSDEGYGSRAPGVVARLMGLDSLPTPNVSGPSIPYSGSCFLRLSHCGSTPNLLNEYQLVEHDNISNKLDRLSSNPVESRFYKVQNRPIERFQTEILPPKSAKPIPITHHRLLSPIRSPGFIPTKNAAYIMEAAAKIIEASPQTSSKNKVPSFGSSSVPLKIQALKEKIEAAHKVSKPQRPDEPSESAAKTLKGRCKNKGQNKSDYTPTSRTSRDSGKGSSNSLRNKGKSISPAEQARVNIQRKEGSFSSGNGNYQKERNDATRKQFSRSVVDMQKTVEKGTSANRTNNVLRQNNQKQNCISSRDYSTSKTSTMDNQVRKARSTNGASELNKTINKVTINSELQSRKTGSVAAASAKELPMSRRKNLPRKKWPVNEDLLVGEIVNSSINGSEKSIKSNVATDGHLNQYAEKIKTKMDVVSFTFTSPVTTSMHDVPSSIRVAENSCSFDSDPSGDNDLPFCKSVAFTSPGFNIIGGDALSVLLEKKFQESTCRFESPNCNIIVEGTLSRPSSSLQNSVPSSGAVTTSMEFQKRLQVDLYKDISYGSGDFNCSSIHNLGLDQRWNWQLPEETEEQNACSSSSGTGIGIGIGHRYPSQLSTLEHAVTSESCSDSIDATNGIKQFLLAQDQDWTPRSESHTEFGTELSDSVSSKSVGELGKMLLTRTSSSKDFIESTDWELDYVKMVLQGSELKFIEYSLGQTENIMTLNAFNQPEHPNGTLRNGEDYNKLEQKLLLDCVSECLELRCDQVFVGSCKGWVRWGKLIETKGWLAEELYKEISGWKSMGDIVVEDLVNKDMSTKHGRWLDFDLEAFEEGLEIEKSILTSLVDELIFDSLNYG